MARNYERKLPEGSLVRTTVCQYCAVGCGYRAFLVPSGAKPAKEDEKGVPVISPAFISPAMRGQVRYKGKEFEAAVAPDARCELNRGNHSVRGGSQGANLVGPNPPKLPKGRSKDDRMRSPQVRCSDGKLHDITWQTANEVMSKLLVEATGLGEGEDGLKASTPERLGVKLYEYQYLENTYAATKLFYRAIGTPNLAYHDRPSAAGSSPGLKDAGYGPHDFAYEDMRKADLLFLAGSNPYENQSVFFMQNLAGKEMIVLDPRMTATAQYAVQTGGLHLRPTRLGADSLVLFALTRAILEALPDEAIHPQIAKTDKDIDRFALAGVKPDDKPQKDAEPDWTKLRRAARALSLAEFKKFLGMGTKKKKPGKKYSLEHASEVSGIPVEDLKEAVCRLVAKVPGKIPGSKRDPIVGTLYEKGLIWGFNYHNTAAVAAFGLATWRNTPEMPAPLTGRCGGHQKGWGEARGKVDGFAKISKGSGYPWGNSKDRYLDDEAFKALHDSVNSNPEHPGIPNWKGPFFKVRHNVDTHVFGPDEAFHPVKVSEGRVLLDNKVETTEKPDVNLLWIIGGNYLGQTHASQWKQERLRERLNPQNLADGKHLPSEGSADEIVATLKKRMEEGGLVVIHQDIFPNPTTELADIVLPAAGWGEEDFIRYNAERRLRLYERFQDPPLHAKDEEALQGKDPLEDPGALQHSAKPDWIIFRDIARRTLELMPEGEDRKNALREFNWSSSAELADELASKHRGGSGRSNRTGMLNAILEFGINHGLCEGESVHGVLGKGGDGHSELLEKGYTVPDGSEVLGNGVATNGVLLPAEVKPEIGKDGEPIPGKSRLEGRFRVVRGGQMNFVRADWEEIEQFFNRYQPEEGQLAITCGRVNHVWNNMFSHIRNDYVLERYPEDMPGTILEVNPEWAVQRNLSNGQVVTVADQINGERSEFSAILSLQDALPEGTAFALFSYPVFDSKKEEFTFQGYPNNLMFGYFDGINPIGTLKYGRGTIEVSGRKTIFKTKAKRRGPTYGQRNRIVSEPGDCIRSGVDPDTGRWSYERRLDWRMRELIVARGLPRAFVHSGVERQEALLDPDATYEYLKKHVRGIFGMMLAAMQWPTKDEGDLKAGAWDRWDGADLDLAMEWSRSVEPDRVDGPQPDLSKPDDELLEDFFLTWSEKLTGFDDLKTGHLDQGRSLLRRVLKHEEGAEEKLRRLIKLLKFRRGDKIGKKKFGKTLEHERDLGESVAILWYNGAFAMKGLGFPDHGKGGFGTMHDDHYRRGLLWRATGLQPQGYSTELENWNEPLGEEEGKQ